MISKKRELKMWIRFYLNGKLYYHTFKGYSYVVDFDMGKTTRISFSYFSDLHAEKYDY